METLREEITGPVSGDLFRDPVLAADGHTYERESIESWFKTKTTSPLTGLPISRTLMPNQLVKKMVLRYLEEHPEESEGQLQFTFEPVVEALKTNNFAVLRRYHAIPLNRRLEDLTYTVPPINEHADEMVETYSLMQLLVERCDNPEIVEWCLTLAEDSMVIDHHGCVMAHYLAARYRKTRRF